MSAVRCLVVASLLSSACAGPFVSTASLVRREPPGGTVRITSETYPPDADVQLRAKELMVQACGGRAWRVVDIAVREASPGGASAEKDNSSWVWVAGYGGPAGRIPPRIPGQVVDLVFVCTDAEAARGS